MLNSISYNAAEVARTTSSARSMYEHFESSYMLCKTYNALKVTVTDFSMAHD